MSVPYDEEDIFFSFSSRKSLRSSSNCSTSVFLAFSGWGTVLDYCDTDWFPLEMNRDHSVILEIAPKYCILGFLLIFFSFFFFLQPKKKKK